MKNNKPIKLFLLAILCFFFIYAIACSPTKYTISEYNGKIVSSDTGEALKNLSVEILLEGKKGSFHGYEALVIYSYNTKTDDNGKFTLPPWEGEAPFDYPIWKESPKLLINYKDNYEVYFLNHSLGYPSLGKFYEKRPSGEIRIKWIGNERCKFSDYDNNILCYKAVKRR